MADLLSKAETSETKSDLEPDYIFQIKVNKVEEYNYIVGEYNGNFIMMKWPLQCPKD